MRSKYLAMLRSRAAGDEEQFFTIALQVAAAEARQGHRSLAEELREAVEKARNPSGRGRPSLFRSQRPAVTSPTS